MKPDLATLTGIEALSREQVRATLHAAGIFPPAEYRASTEALRRVLIRALEHGHASVTTVFEKGTR